MTKEERLNEEAALNNNLDSSTLRRNREITNPNPSMDRNTKKTKRNY
ncbi:hypothetical protein [Ornithinibacillus xuwenensis]|uniref:Multidrug transporter n=1 Tax=Ornithinibacillus xuwenensis TaxID=3144668 RepID=A0ABU9XCM9_9BACI